MQLLNNPELRVNPLTNLVCIINTTKHTLSNSSEQVQTKPSASGT